MIPSRPPRRTVLVVEDEPLLLDIVSEEIEEAGFSVIRALTAEAALEVLRSEAPIDLLFTDIRLPGSLNGWRLAEIAHRLRSGLPVIYATGFSDVPPPQIDPGLFFLKPYRIGAIVDTVRKVAS